MIPPMPIQLIHRAAQVPPPTSWLTPATSSIGAAVPSAPRSSVPGPELPAIPSRHPALPSPPPSLEQLARLADRAPTSERFTPGSHPSMIRNAHYTNTRAQLAHALAGRYNSVEGDVRLRDGRPVMQHDSDAAYDLTFEQWALLAHRAGKHLRIDLKEPGTLPQVEDALRRIGVPAGSITFNVALATPWSAGMRLDEIRALRERFPTSWVTLNLPLPFGPGYLLAARAARAIGGDRLGVAVMAGLVHRRDVELLRRSFAVVNAWNLPFLGDPDIEQVTAQLRALGVNGMLDLRRRDDPLASD
jgi:hypothetical protein